MAQRKDQRTEKATSLATKIYSNLQANPKHQIDGWARKQRAAWGENVDHITRGTTSPLGGRATSSKPKK